MGYTQPYSFHDACSLVPSRSPGDELARGNPFIPRKLTDYSRNIVYSLKCLLFFYYSGNNFRKLIDDVLGNKAQSSYAGPMQAVWVLQLTW